MTDDSDLAAVDRQLLEALARTPNVVRAARAIGISRDRAVYRLARLARRVGPVTIARRGGADGGRTTLAPAGRRLLARAHGGRAGTNRWVGTFRRGPPPSVEVAPGRSLVVAFRAAAGARVTVELPPSVLIVAPRRATLSARNALPAVVEWVRPRADGTAAVAVRWGPVPVRVEVTVDSLDRLGLARGRPVILYAKAVSVRRVATPGSLRS